MGKIQDEARRQRLWKDLMTREEVKKVYEKCYNAVVITAPNKGRPRSVELSSGKHLYRQCLSNNEYITDR
jgi:hypothetical protein